MLLESGAAEDSRGLERANLRGQTVGQRFRRGQEPNPNGEFSGNDWQEERMLGKNDTPDPRLQLVVDQVYPVPVETGLVTNRPNAGRSYFPTPSVGPFDPPNGR